MFIFVIVVDFRVYFIGSVEFLFFNDIDIFLFIVLGIVLVLCVSLVVCNVIVLLYSVFFLLGIFVFVMV